MDFSQINVRVKIIESEKLKGIATVNIDGVSISGFQIKTSTYLNDAGEYLWITPPCYLTGGKYKPLVYLPDKPSWKMLEKLITEAYLKQFEKHTSEKMTGLGTSHRTPPNEKREINPDDIF